MPRGRKRVCVLCGKPIEDKNDSVPYKGRYAHNTCFRVAVKAVHVNKTERLEEKVKQAETKQKETKKKGRPSKPKAELKDAITEEQYIQKKLYYDYLRGFFGIKLPAKIYALTERYIQQYDFTYQKMYQTLTYMHNILEKEFTDDIVGLIPYYYDKADKHYHTVKQVEENNKDKDIKEMYKNRTVYIDPKKKKRKQIDITSIGEGE